MNDADGSLIRGRLLDAIDDEDFDGPFGRLATNGSWSDSYTYDGFGNLTGKTPTAGTAYDANGNPSPANAQTGIAGYTWDVENRLVNVGGNVVGTVNYSYDPWGRRIWKEIPGTQGGASPGEIYFYGVPGQKLETYSFSYGASFNASLEGINVYFGGKLLQSKGNWVATDKLGSVPWNAGLGAINYWPYGEERTSTANGVEKFGTYTRDAVGQDYAAQRYYSASTGAFWTPDPGGITTANPKNPSSWNRYAYVLGDPVNHSDRRGLYVDAEDCANNPDECSNCLPGSSFWGQPPGCDDDEGGDGGGPPVEASSGTSAQQSDQCSVSLWERPTPTASSPGWHTYLSTSVFDPNTGTTTTEDIEGGPQPAWDFIGGKLTGTVAPPGLGLNKGTGDATNPKLSTNNEVGTTYSGSNACSDISALMGSVASNNSGNKVTYSFLGIGGYNSNSFTFTLDSQLGLVSFFGQPAGWIPGWGKLVPGL